jgi:putative ABC transport system permease protein
MRILRALRVSIRGLLARRMRVMLAVSSVAAGVVAVVVTGAIGQGAQEEVLRQTESIGTNLLVVRPVEVSNSAARKNVRGVVTTLKLDDYQAIAHLARVSAAVPGFESSVTVKADNLSTSAMVLGTTSPYLDVSRFRLQQGRFITDDDDLSANRVAVLGARINETLFGESSAIGQQIRIRNVPFEIVGVLEAKGVLADGSDEDDRIVIPIRTALRRVFNSTWLNPIFISARDVTEMDETRSDVNALLRERHGLDQRNKSDDFSIQDKTKVLATRKQLADSLTLLATGLAAASLVVGGAGILAMMLLSVKERTTEIGLRMAIGAKPKDILLQFLLEATSIAAGGWLAGMVVAAGAAAIIGRTTGWTTSISSALVFTTLAIEVTSGLIFGAYPAWKASLMAPMQALRME